MDNIPLEDRWLCTAEKLTNSYMELYLKVIIDMYPRDDNYILRYKSKLADAIYPYFKKAFMNYMDAGSIGELTCIVPRSITEGFIEPLHKHLRDRTTSEPIDNHPAKGSVVITLHNTGYVGYIPVKDLPNELFRIYDKINGTAFYKLMKYVKDTVLCNAKIEYRIW